MMKTTPFNRVNKIRRLWQRLPLRHRVLGAVLCLAAALVVVKYVDVASLLKLPMASAVEQERQALDRLSDELEKVQQNRQAGKEKIAQLRNTLGRFVWQLEQRNPTSFMQSELEKRANANNVTIQAMGSPRTQDVTEHIRSAQLSVRISSNMREIVRFLTAVDGSEKRFYWNSCHIRPSAPGESSKVRLSGQLQMMYLTPDVEKLLFEQAGS